MDRSERNKEGELVEKLVKLNRVSKVVKGGRRFSFSALVVVGDQNGKVGYGSGKANDITEAIRKAVDKAKESMFVVPMSKATIPHEIIGDFKGSSVLLRPAVPGTGVIAGGAVRHVMDACGIKDVLAKSLGSKNAVNTVKATFVALEQLFDAKELAKSRGKTLGEMWG
ncbi:MAG: 30S ribosomal protein S5 [Sphaerochaetaceae bacterium]